MSVACGYRSGGRVSGGRVSGGLPQHNLRVGLGTTALPSDCSWIVSACSAPAPGRMSVSERRRCRLIVPGLSAPALLQHRAGVGLGTTALPSDCSSTDILPGAGAELLLSCWHREQELRHGHTSGARREVRRGTIRWRSHRSEADSRLVLQVHRSNVEQQVS